MNGDAGLIFGLRLFRGERTTSTSAVQAFADMVLADPKPRGRIQPIGKIHKAVVKDMRDRGVALKSDRVVINDETIIKYINHPKEKKGAVLDSRDYWRVERTVNRPRHIYVDKQQKELIYAYSSKPADKNVLKVVIHPNYYRNSRYYNLLKSIGIVPKRSLNNKSKYEKIK